MTDTRMIIALKLVQGCPKTMHKLKFWREQQVLGRACAIEHRTSNHTEKKREEIRNKKVCVNNGHLACNATTVGACKPPGPMLWFLHWEIWTELNLILSYANVITVGAAQARY